MNGLTIRWVWARRRGKARRARATKAAAKVENVEKVEFGQQLEITEATGYRPERKSRDRADFISLRSTNTRTPGITMARALSLEPS